MSLLTALCSGGLELLFSNNRKHQLSLPSSDEKGQAANLAFLVRYLCENLMKDQRKEMFVMDGTVSVFAIFHARMFQPC